MLNYIWLALIVIGVFVAVGRDVSDISTDKYRNNAEMPIKFQLDPGKQFPIEPGKPYKCTIQIYSDEYNKIFPPLPARPDVIFQNAEFIASNDNAGILHVFVDDKTPPMWKEIYKAQRNTDYLSAHIRVDINVTTAYISFDPVKFVNITSVTNDGIIKYAKTAVELAIGLIGIMALWLGIMKIADQSGLVAKLASGLKPVMTRLFPDVPAEHPAMGAMIMNISANILGLANAATPFGLKAMEELNKLNKKLGTATDAMCTFLVINTSSVQLIPATVIAIRAAAGSANPTEILGPVIVATTVNTTVGIIAVKLLARLPVFKKQLVVGE